MGTWDQLLEFGLLPAIAIVLSATAGIFSWYLSQRSKMNLSQHRRKQERYIELLNGAQGFYDDTAESELGKGKQEFIQSYEKCWLYCPDPLIEALDTFLQSISDEESSEEKRYALGECVIQMRKDLLSRRVFGSKRTKLTAGQFSHYKVAP